MPGTNSRIARVTARQILDSRGRPTIEVDVVLEGGTVGRACAPSGASTGRHEARELRDGNMQLYAGRGVLRAVENVRSEISDALTGQHALDQEALDRTLIALDGTHSLSRLGANAILATSLAAARAAAEYSHQPLYRHLSNLAGTPMNLPMPMTNILSGGAHAGRGMDVQDFLAIPVGADSYTQALEMIGRVRDAAASLMKEDGLSILLADEGGLSPGFAETERALELMVRSFEAAGLRPGTDVAIALDVAASELYADGHYELAREDRRLSSDEMISYLTQLIRRYPIISIEDALDQDDWEGWSRLTAQLPEVQTVGDDLFATNVARITQGIGRGAANAALIKVNQNGTLTGTLAAMAASRDGDYAIVGTARSGETEDAFIADLAVGTGAGQIKIGSVRNSERLGKYNQLLRIEEEANLEFAGVSGLAGKRRLTTA